MLIALEARMHQPFAYCALHRVLATAALAWLVAACGGGSGGGEQAASHSDERHELPLVGEIVGPLSSIDARRGTVVVMGQTIRIDAGTAFGTEIEGFDALSVGQKLEVRATFDLDAGTYQATRVDGGHGSDRLRLQVPDTASVWARRS